MSDDYYCESILNGKVPVQIVAETQRVLAFHHTARSWDTHIVVIPKRHVRSLVDNDDPSLLTEMLQLLVQIIRDKGMDKSNYKIIANGGSYQSSQHLHIHLVSGNPIDPDSAAQRGELAV
jgi:histidine triad (HIT) family protein